ncbi:MAG: hypothetical protein IKW32_04225 [Bacteroidaceae bacterium]|nr:hypothetical protein [Bacteroidaceae bacterium]
MRIGELFDGSYKRKNNAIEVTVKGETLKRYRLKLFRSLTVKNDPMDFERIEKLVEADGKDAVSKETGRIGERLYYAFYCFPPHNDRLRYVFYRNSSLREVEENELTLVYIEGNVTMDELKEMFKK